MKVEILAAKQPIIENGIWIWEVTAGLQLSLVAIVYPQSEVPSGDVARPLGVIYS